MGRIVDRPFDGSIRVRTVERPEPGLDTEDPPGRRVDDGLVDLSAPHAVGQWRAHVDRRPRHLEVEPGGPSARVVRAPPVGHDEPVEAPLTLEQLGEEPVVL